MSPNKETIFIGTVKTDINKQDNVIGLYIEFRIDTLVIARSVIQQDGSFKISATADNEFDIYYKGVGVVDTYIQTIKPIDRDTVLLTFRIPKDYEEHFGNAVCPKCGKFDQTIPIAYGLKTIVVYEKDQPAYTTYDGYGKKEVYDGGCVTSEIAPKYYCKRDKIKF